MHPEGILLHIGVNYVLAPPPEIDKRKSLGFQQALVEAGIDFDSVEDNTTEITVVKKNPPLQVRVINAVEAPVGQILMVASHPNRTPEDFIKETEAIVQAFHKTWEGQRQIIACDSTIRYLHETSGEHAFKELWETRLQQPESSLRAFDRPVLGGGLRFVMPPVPENEPSQVEVKIESYLRDSKKIFIEVEFKWPEPKSPGTPFDPAKQLRIVDRFIEERVISFINEAQDE